MKIQVPASRNPEMVMRVAVRAPAFRQGGPSPANPLRPILSGPCFCLALCPAVPSPATHLALCPGVPSPANPRYPRCGCVCIDAVIGFIQGAAPALSGQTQVAEPLSSHVLPGKPSPALSGQPMLLSGSLSGCTIASQAAALFDAVNDAARRMYGDSSSGEDPSPAIIVSAPRNTLRIDGLFAGASSWI